MNCPQCQQPVGSDQYSFGDWRPGYGPHGGIIGSSRLLAIQCDHCGLFKCEQDYLSGRICKTGGPYHNTKDVRHLERRIPGCRFTRRIPT